jgi:predicted TIM-barrel fold metal-dependent hydrolase
MHLHALAVDALGPPPLAFDLPINEWPVHDPAEPWREAFMRWHKSPRGPAPIWSGATEEEIRDRVMFGTDQMVWPGVIEPAIEAIESATFLTDEQKRQILYGNAARFLRLSQTDIDRHHSA